MKYDHILAITSCTDLPELAWQIRMSCETLAGDDEISAEVLLALLRTFHLSPDWCRTKQGNPYLLSSDDNALQRLMQVETVCKRSCRGIFKRIDENRELLKCLQEHGADVLKRCCWIEGWIAGQDIFLVDLVAALEWVQLDIDGWSHSGFPRPWPGSSNLESSYHRFGQHEK